MTLEQQVTSLELSKKLKTIGVKQESYFVWGRQTATRDVYKVFASEELEKVPLQFNTISAFTVAELCKMHFDKFGKCYVRPNISPEYLADYLAESYITTILKPRPTPVQKCSSTSSETSSSITKATNNQREFL